MTNLPPGCNSDDGGLTGDYDLESVVSPIRKPDIQRFQHLTKALDKLMHDIYSYNPDVSLYIEDSGHFHLMNGADHDMQGNALQENIVSSTDVFMSGGGAW